MSDILGYIQNPKILTDSAENVESKEVYKELLDKWTGLPANTQERLLDSLFSKGMRSKNKTKSKLSDLVESIREYLIEKKLVLPKKAELKFMRQDTKDRLN